VTELDVDGDPEGEGVVDRLRALAARTARRGPGGGLFLALCGLLALGFFATFAFSPGRMLFGTDMLGQAFQLRQFAVEEIRAGRGIPLWNPFVYGGLPYVGVLPGPLFYPSSLLYLVMPLFRAIGWTFVLHMAAGGALGWAAARAFGLRRWSAAATGLAFMFTGYVVSTLYGGHDGRMFAMVLVPAVFACAEKGFSTRTWTWFVGMGLVVALQIFTPHVQVMYFSSLAVSLYALFRLGSLWRAAPEGGRSAVWPLAAGFAGGFVVAALAGAVQLLPAADLLRHAVRGAGGGQGGYEFASSWALPPQELSALFLPDLLGSLQELYWGSNPFKLHTEYLGAGTLALAFTGALAPRGDRRVWFFSGASLLGIAFALGAATPVHRIAFEVVPLIDNFRAPAMMLGPVSFFVALLAGFGVDRVLDARESGVEGDGADGAPRARSPAGTGDAGEAADGTLPWGWIAGVSAPFLILALWAALDPEGLTRWVRHGWFRPGWPRSPSAELLGMLRATGGAVLLVWGGSLTVLAAVARRRLPRWALAGVLLLLVADLWRVDARYLDTVDPERAFSAGPVVERMREGLRQGERVWQLEDSFGANELMTWRIPSVTGSQNFRLAWYDRLVGGVGMRDLLERPALWPLLDLRYLTTRSPVQTPLLRPVPTEGRARLHEVTADLPHAYFPDSVRAVEGLDAALSATRSLRDPGALAVVETGEGSPGAGDGASPGPPSGGRGRATLERWTPDEVTLRVEAERGGLLVVSEVWHPGWEARLDGQPVPVLRADAALRGIRVPEGSHRIRFRYVSLPFRVGAGLSLATVLAALAALALRWRRRRA
jgi:hypothetical protein